MASILFSTQHSVIVNAQIGAEFVTLTQSYSINGMAGCPDDDSPCREEHGYCWGHLQCKGCCQRDTFLPSSSRLPTARNLLHQDSLTLLGCLLLDANIDKCNVFNADPDRRQQRRIRLRKQVWRASHSWLHTHVRPAHALW